MLAAILSRIAGGLVAPITRLGEAWIRHKNDRLALEHGTERIANEASTRFGIALLGTWAGRLPLFALLMAVDCHVAAVFIDSTWPGDMLNPLELPRPYQTIMETVVVAQVGLGVWKSLRG